MSANKPPFEEYLLGDKYVLRFYRVDHGLICSIDENMIDELRKVTIELSQAAEENKALHNLVKEQDKKIIELAFDLVYEQRSNEIVRELKS